MRRLSTTGVICGSFAWVFAWLPSLLPSGTLLHGVALGVSASVGYGIGAALASLIAATTRRTRPTAPRQPSTSSAVATASAGLAIFSGAWLAGGLNTQAEQLGAPQYAVQWLLASVIGLAVFAVLLVVARGLRRMAVKVSRWLPHRFGPTTRDLTAVLVTGALMLGLAFTGVMAMRVAFDRIDAGAAGQSAPASSARSGSAESLIAFDSLGRQGRAFVTQGDDPKSIRSYAGLESAPTPAQRAELAVADMLRAGGAQSPVWIGITTTGNGFVDPAAADAAESATGGQAALVALQYSTLPSWLSFLVDQTSAKEAGTALYLALAQARDALPESQRPRLILYGESLGAFGSAAPFAGMAAEEVAERVDGALWVGPPAATQPVSQWTYSGTPPVWQPILADGRTVRYAATPSAAQAPPGEGPWLAPRILVLQNPTDPVVWFTPDLAYRPASWLTQPRGPGVQEGTRWFPGLFFLQVALDLPQAVSMPSGVGHDYDAALLAAWQQVLVPQG